MSTVFKKDYAAERTALMDKLELSIVPKFVPFSKSRNKKENPKFGDLSVNWRVTLMRGNREILTTDYMQGIGHISGYSHSARKTIDFVEAVKTVCETGKSFRALRNLPHMSAVEPNREDFLYSLIMDSDVLNYTSFEYWAESTGYNPDSRKGEKVYQACLKIALAMRSGLGDSNLETLSELFQDF